MAEEIDFDNGRSLNYEGFMTLTLDRVTYYRVVLMYLYLHTKSHSNWTNHEKLFCGRMDKWTYCMDARVALIGRLSQGVDLKNTIHILRTSVQQLYIIQLY